MASRAFQHGELVWTDNRGRNGFDVPSDVRDGQCVEAVNIRLERNQLGRKRYGSRIVNITGLLGGDSWHLARFVPAQNEQAAELFVLTDQGVFGHITPAASAELTPVTLPDPLNTRPQDMVSVQLNGKLFIFYKSAVNRAHVYDPKFSTAAVRRAGLVAPAQMAAPTNTGSGSYQAIVRYYKTAWRVKQGSLTYLQSELSPARSATPSGSGTGLVLTKPAASSPAEGETHWVVYGSVDDGAYFLLAELPVGTTTYTDSEIITLYGTHEAAPVVGTHTPLPSAKYAISTGTRLVLFGVWEDATNTGDGMTPVNGRVYFTPVLGTTGLYDDEYISNDRVGLSETGEGWIDVGRDHGVEDRAIAGPYDGNVLVFQSRGFYLLLQTAQAAAPFERITMNPTIGAVNQWSTFMGEDENGRTCVYWLDPYRGPYRYGAHGLQWLGYDVQDLWKHVNLDASVKVAHGVYDPSTRCCKWWIAFGTHQSPAIADDNPALVFSVRDGVVTENDGVREGWTIDRGYVTGSLCSVVFSTVIGPIMSRALSTYTGNTSLMRCDDPHATNDGGAGAGGVPFQAYVTSRAWDVSPGTANKRIGQCYLKAAASEGVDIQQAVTKNYGDGPPRLSSVSLSATNGEQRVLRKFQDAALVDAYTFQVQVGDDVARETDAWELDEWVCTLEGAEQR